MLEPSSLGEMTWKPPGSHGASVQQDPGVTNKEEGDPGGSPGHQLTASMKAAFPAGRLTLSSPSQQEKQGGCNIWWLLSVLQELTCPVLPGLRFEQQIPDYLTSMYARNSGKHQPFPPHPLGGGVRLYNQHRSTQRSLIHHEPWRTEVPAVPSQLEERVLREMYGPACKDSSIRSSKP